MFIYGRNTYYIITDKRGDTSKGPLALLDGFKGILVHDHFKPYYKYLEDITHAECNAHILRYLQAGVDFYNNPSCAAMINLLKSSLQRKEELMKEGNHSMPKEERNNIRCRYRQIIEKELTDYKDKNPNMPKKYIPDYIKML